jgi:Tol biopolymer transport system component
MKTVCRNLICGLLLLLLSVPAQALAPSFPTNKLPQYITRLTDFGERPDWSLDGTRILYLTESGGDVFEIDIRTGQTKPISLHYQRPQGWGYYRALYLSNGDYLLTGGPSRQETYLQILDKSLTRPPKVFEDVLVAEGPAVSRRQLKVAWTAKQEKIWVADIVYRNGNPRLLHRKQVIDNRSVVADGEQYEGMVEPQNFRPPDDKELIWSQYGMTESGIFTAEVMGCDLESGKLTNYSKAPNQYDEPEGIFPDGQYTLVESDRHHPVGTAYIDIYRLKLDGSGRDLVRLTHFSDVRGFRASNPVVRDDGLMFAFQESRADSPPGSGDGIYLFDLVKAGLAQPKSSAPESKATPAPEEPPSDGTPG